MAQYTNDQDRRRKTFQLLAQKMDAGKTQSDSQGFGSTAMTETRRNTFRQLASMTSRMDSTAYHTEKQKRINEILQGARDYFSNAQKKIDGMSWSTAKSVNDEVSRNSKRMLEEHNEVKQYLDAYGDKMDKDTYNSLQESLRWMDQARAQVQSIVADRASYFGSFNSEDAYIKGAAEAADQRQQRYADNQKRIEELQAQRASAAASASGSAIYNPDSNVMLPFYNPAQETVKQIDEEIERLKKDNRQYENGEGDYAFSKTADEERPYVEQYYQTYSGKTYDELMAIIGTLEEGKEKEWLTAYAPTVMTVENAEKELARLQQERSTHVDTEFDWTDANARNAYDSKLAELDAQIEKAEKNKWDLENKEKYRALSSNSDFAALSEADLENHASDYTYRFINDANTRHMAYAQGMNGGAPLEMRKGYDKLEPEEVATFNYLYHKEGEKAAREYLHTLENELSARKQQANAQQWQKVGQEYGLLADAISVGGSLMGSAGYIDILVQKIEKGIKEAVTGKYAGPIDYNSTAQTPSVISSAIRGERSAQWAKDSADVLNAMNIQNENGVIAFDTEDHPVLSKLFNGRSMGDVYQLGMSMVDSYVSAKLAPFIGTAGSTMLLAGNAATQTTLDKASQGATDGQALTMGLLAGAFEYIFEKYEIENLLGADTNVLRKMGNQAITEGLGEGATSFANTVADVLVMAKQSDLSKAAAVYMLQHPEWSESQAWKQALLDTAIDIGWDMVGGAFTGGIMGGTESVLQNIAIKLDETTQYRNIGKEIIGNTESVERLTALANELDGISAYDLGKQAQSVSEKATSKNVGRLLSDIYSTINEQNSKDLSARLQEKGITADRANAIADAVIAARSDSTSLTQEQTSLLEQVSKDTAVTEAVSEILDTEGSAAYQRSEQLRAALTEISAPDAQADGTDADTAVSPLTKLARQTVEDQYAAEDTTAEDLGIQSAEGKILLEGNAVQIADVETAGKGKVTVKLTDGRSVDASALEFPDTGEAELWRVVGKYAEDAASARALLDEYRGGNLDAYKYARGVEEGFLYGKLNISPKQMEMEGSYVNLLNPMQRNMAYQQGRIAGNRQTQQRQAEASRRDPSNRRKGAVHYGYEGETLDESKLNPSQRVGVDFAKRLAKRKGMTFYFYRSYMQNGVRVFKNPEGKIVKATKKGWYNPADGSIHVDLNCGDMGSTVLYTIAHELGHHIKDWSAAKFRTLCGIVTEGFVSRGQSVDELVLNKQAEYREMGVELTYEEAYEEVICSALEGVIDDGRVMELLDLAEKKDMSLADRLRSALKNIADLIRETIEAYRNTEPESPEGRMVMKMGDLRKQIQEAFADALHDAGENYREGGKINTAQLGGTKNSIVVLDNGNVYVQASRNVITGTTKAQQRQNITDFFKALLDGNNSLDIHTIEGDVLTITKAETATKARDDYKTVKGAAIPMTDDEFAVKLRVESHIDEIAEASQAPKNQKKIPDAKNHAFARGGFTYRRAYFEDFDGQYYEVTLSVGHNGNVATVYNVGKIDKSTLPSAKIIAVVGSKPLGKVLSKNSIRNSDPKVNKNSLRYQKNAAAQSHMEEQNASMAEDMEGLNQLVTAQQQRGGDGRLQSGALNAAANFLMKTASAKGEKMELIKLLNAFYQHVATSTEQTWESVREQAMPVVRWLMKHAVHTKQRSEYSQDILNHLHDSRISLDDVQKGEVAHLYGSFGAYRNSVMGSVILANDGIPLDSAWQELAEIYPDVFDRDMNAADMPDALADIIYRLRNEDTSELEYEYSREFVEQELLQRVYDSYWNASTLYSVADHYEKQIKQLKGKHNRRMQEVYARHRAAETNQQIIYRQRQEAARAHYEEQYQRREAEYRESRKKAVERHDQTQMRQKIKRVVRDLWKLQERAPKHRRTKEELRSFVDSAIKAADLIWLERYDEYDMIRNGIDDKYLRGDEKRLLEECRELLEKHLEISDADIDTRWDIDSALQQAKDKAALDKELAKRMKILRDNGVFAEEFKRLHEMDAGQILKDLLDSYKKLQSTDSPYLANAYQEKIQIRLQEIIDDIGVKPIRNMTLQELEKLYEAYNGVLHVVRDANKLFADERAGEITTLGTRIVNEMDGFSRKAMGRKFMETLRQTGWSNLTPAYVFRRLGSGTLERLYKNMVKGMGTYGHDIAEAKAHWQKQAKKHGAFDWDMDKRTEFVDKTGTKFSLSLGQLMSLYALSRRQQALGHLEIGGIRLDAEENYVENVVDRVLPKVMRDASVFKLDKAALSAICSKLTPEQKAFVETTQGYLSTVMAEKGNDVSMKLYGIRLFREKIYFPLRTANDTRYQSTELIDQNKLKNSGFTKETNPDANNAVVLSDYSKVWTSHVKKMSLYHGMTLPMEDMDRMLNFGRTFARDENGNIRRDKDGNPVEEFEGDSISATMRNIWGEHPENYLRDMMKQLNGGVRSDSAEDLPGKMLSRFKKSAVAGSLSVWIQQWTSVFRSMAYIPMKHFFQKPMGKQRTAIVEEMKKHCPIAIIKEMGGFDTGMGNSEHDYITMRDPENAKELIQEIKKHPVKRFDELTGWLPGHADETTWAHIWTAVKRETLENHPELKRGSDEFYKAASDRFTEVINLTQVYDSVLSKSALMRSKGFGAKMITQFASEPTVALNMAVDAMLQQHRTGKLQVGTAFALVGSVVANAMSSALIYAMRDDDEEETFWEKYSASMLGNLLDGLNPLTYIPIIRDIWSAAQGYDVKRSDMEIWGQVLSSLEELVRKYNDEDATDKDRAEAWAGAADWILALFGVPAKNIRREMKGFGNLWRTLEADYDRETTARSMGDVIQDTWWSSIPLLRLIKGETKAKKLMDAYMTGDTKYADRLRGTYKTEDSANNAVVKEIQSRFEDGKLTDNQVIEYLTKYAGKTDEKAQDYLTKWRFAMENPDTVLEDSQFLKYTEFAEPAGISQEIYAQYAAEIKACESETDGDGKIIVSRQEKVWAVINSLPISKKQKDALHYASGYKESSLEDAPWN